MDIELASAHVDRLRSAEMHTAYGFTVIHLVGNTHVGTSLSPDGTLDYAINNVHAQAVDKGLTLATFSLVRLTGNTLITKGTMGYYGVYRDPSVPLHPTFPKDWKGISSSDKHLHGQLPIKLLEKRETQSRNIAQAFSAIYAWHNGKPEDLQLQMSVDSHFLFFALKK